MVLQFVAKVSKTARKRHQSVAHACESESEGVGSDLSMRQSRYNEIKALTRRRKVHWVPSGLFGLSWIRSHVLNGEVSIARTPRVRARGARDESGPGEGGDSRQFRFRPEVSISRPKNSKPCITKIKILKSKNQNYTSPWRRCRRLRRLVRRQSPTHLRTRPTLERVTRATGIVQMRHPRAR